MKRHLVTGLLVNEKINIKREYLVWSERCLIIGKKEAWSLPNENLEGISLPIKKTMILYRSSMAMSLLLET